MKDGAWCVLPA